ncbi:transposase [Streptomyces bobili]|uniref:transposase n=1 Tax=Streptomyces bobili TaxID=67280 RepID=UPI0037975E8C
MGRSRSTSWRPRHHALRQGGRGRDLEEDLWASSSDGLRRHGQGGTGEPVAALLRRGLQHGRRSHHHRPTCPAQWPKKYRRGRRTLICTDSAAGTHDFVSWLAKRGRRLSYSVGMVITETIHRHVLKIPAPAWTPAVEADRKVRDRAWSPNSPAICWTAGRRGYG